MCWGLGNLSSNDLLRHCYLKLHTYGLHLMHVITIDHVMGRDMWVKNKLYSILLPIKAVDHKRDTPLSLLSPSFVFKLQYKQENWGLELLCSGPLPPLRECISTCNNLCFVCCFCAFCPILRSICQRPRSLTTKKDPDLPFLPYLTVTVS
jgi:hypothetical protein